MKILLLANSGADAIMDQFNDISLSIGYVVIGCATLAALYWGAIMAISAFYLLNDDERNSGSDFNWHKSPEYYRLRHERKQRRKGRS